MKLKNNNIYYMLNDSSVIHMESYNYLDSVGYNCTIEGFKSNKKEADNHCLDNLF
jgi:hypothetical protein